MPREKDMFLVAVYMKAPRDPKQSSRKGYMNDDKNISYREKVTITRGLKDRDLTAGIILNLTQKTVYKCRFEGKNDWETLAAYYAKSYPKYFKLEDPKPPTDKEVEKAAAVEVPVEEKAAKKTKKVTKKRSKKEAKSDATNTAD